MSDTADTAQVIIRPPIAWALAVLAGLALNWLMPLPFVPGMLSTGWLGATVFALALVLVGSPDKIGMAPRRRRAFWVVVTERPVALPPVWLGEGSMSNADEYRQFAADYKAAKASEIAGQEFRPAR